MKLQNTCVQQLNTDKRTGILLGILLISGIVFGILNTVPALEYPNYLIKLSEIKTQVLVAIFFQFAMAAVYVCIASITYPIIRKYNADLGTVYFGFRIIGAAFLFVGIASLSLLLSLSQSYVSASPIDGSYFLVFGELLRTGRDLMNHVGMILPWMSGGLILCYCLFRIRLVPRWLSVLGISAALLTLLATLLLMLGFIRITTPIYFIMNTPSAFFEVSLAMFLIVKGFNPINFETSEKVGIS